MASTTCHPKQVNHSNTHEPITHLSCQLLNTISPTTSQLPHHWQQWSHWIQVVSITSVQMAISGSRNLIPKKSVRYLLFPMSSLNTTSLTYAESWRYCCGLWWQHLDHRIRSENRYNRENFPGHRIIIEYNLPYNYLRIASSLVRWLLWFSSSGIYEIGKSIRDGCLNLYSFSTTVTVQSHGFWLDGIYGSRRLLLKFVAKWEFSLRLQRNRIHSSHRKRRTWDISTDRTVTCGSRGKMGKIGKSLRDRYILFEYNVPTSPKDPGGIAGSSDATSGYWNCGADK